MLNIQFVNDVNGSPGTVPVNRRGALVSGVLLQVTFFPGSRSISEAAGLFRGHVWFLLGSALLCLIILSVASQLIPAHQHMQGSWYCAPPPFTTTQ